MSDTKTFLLPDLGEGLPDATIVEWAVKVGDTIRLDDTLVSMETAKAVVEVPSPVSGKVLKLAGAAGDVVVTGTMLAEFEIDPNLPQRADGQDTGHHHGGGHAAPAKAEEAAPAKAEGNERADSGTVVGAMQSSDAVAEAPAPAAAPARSTLSQSGRPMRTQPPGAAVTGQPEQLKGVRRNMARVMADAHSKVVPTTLADDADIHAWLPGNDITGRLVRAIVVACKTVPALNAWFDGDKLTRTLHPHVDIGIAVDTDDGLFVPALRNADVLDPRGVREAINRLRAQVEDRSIAASELSGYTISLSNFGMFAGRYATPVVVPPTVAIVAAGKGRHQMTPVMGGFESHKVIPLSLTFDHRACTGGEAARFLKAMIDDLARAH